MILIRKLCEKKDAEYPTGPRPIINPNNASRTSFRFALLPKDSFSGLADVFPSAFALANNGDSFIFFLIHTEIITIKADAKKGIRQPQSSHAFVLMEFFEI